MIRETVLSSTVEIHPASESPGIPDSSAPEAQGVSLGFPAFLSRPPEACLEEVTAGARRGARRRMDPHIVMGNIHIHRDGRDYDIPAAHIDRRASAAGLRELRERGFSGPFATNAGVYYLDTRDPDIAFARRDLLMMQRDGIGHASFHN